MNNALLEATARTETICCGCGAPKEPGLIVRWHCFKYRDDIVPFKYFDGSLAKWARTLAA